MSSQILIDRFLRSENSHQRNLHAHEKLLLFFLASYMGKKTMCYPSHQSLANDCTLSSDSVKRRLKSLEKKNIITVSRKSGCNNQYAFNLKIINEPSADSTQCCQHLEADSTTHPVPTAPTPSAHSTPNNISNNIKECTSNICEVETSPVRASDDLSTSASTQEIFKHWQTTMNHPRAKLSTERQRAIKKALKLGYSVNDLTQALDGCADSPFHMGENDRKQVYDYITLIFRDAEHIERFINNDSSTAHATKSTDDLMAGVI